MNLGLGQTAWTQLFRELGLYDKPIKEWRDAARKADGSLSRIQVRDNNASASLLSSWTLSGAKFGVNVAETGQLFPRVTKDSVTTTVAAGSNGVNVNTFVGAQTLNVASTTGFPAAGTITVATGSGAQVVAYTGGGGGGTTFTGCSCAGAGVLATGGAVAVCTVSLYTAIGASGLVAQGLGAYPSTVTLAAQNASGLGATVAVGTLAASEAVDTHFLTVFPDHVVNARAVLDGSQPEHAQMLTDYLAALATAQGAFTTAIAAVKTAKDKFLSTRLSRTINTGQGSLLNLATKSTNGAVTTDYFGVLPDLSQAMADETTPAAQTILKNALALGAAVFTVTNDGLAALSGSLAEFASAGTIQGVCTNATRGSEQFALTQRINGTNAIIDGGTLQIDQAFADPALGISAMLLKRTLTLAVGAANDFGAMSNWTLVGLSSGNTDTAGKVYPKVIVGVIDPTKWIQQLYSSSTLAAATLVAQSAEAAAAATGVVLTAQNGSNLTGVVAIGAAPTANHSGTINCNFFSTQNAAKNVADSFSVPVTQTSAGEIQDLMRATESFALNSAPTAPTIPDGIASAGTFPPYSVRDV